MLLFVLYRKSDQGPVDPVVESLDPRMILCDLDVDGPDPGPLHLLDVLFPSRSTCSRSSATRRSSPAVGYLSAGPGPIIVTSVSWPRTLVAKLGIRNVLATSMFLAERRPASSSARSRSHGSYSGHPPARVPAGRRGDRIVIRPCHHRRNERRRAPNEAGVASGLITTTQQIGGALGVAVLSTLAVSATTRFIGGHTAMGRRLRPTRCNHGFSIAFWFGALFAGIGCLIAFFGHGPHSYHRGHSIDATDRRAPDPRRAGDSVMLALAN